MGVLSSQALQVPICSDSVSRNGAVMMMQTPRVAHNAAAVSHKKFPKTSPDKKHLEPPKSIILCPKAALTTSHRRVMMPCLAWEVQIFAWNKRLHIESMHGNNLSCWNTNRLWSQSNSSSRSKIYTCLKWVNLNFLQPFVPQKKKFCKEQLHFCTVFCKLPSR